MINKTDGTPITNDREAFEYVVSFLKNQGGRCIDESDACKYRGFTENFLADMWKSIRDQYHDIDEANDYYREKLIDAPYNGKCAAGSLIDDTFYDYDFEERVLDWDHFEAIIASNPLWKCDKNSFKMIEHLQAIHDNNKYNLMFEAYEELQNSFDENNKYMPDNFVWPTGYKIIKNEEEYDNVSI